MDTRASRPRTRSKGSPTVQNVWIKKKRKSGKKRWSLPANVLEIEQESFDAPGNNASIQAIDLNVVNSEMSSDESQANIQTPNSSTMEICADHSLQSNVIEGTNNSDVLAIENDAENAAEIQADDSNAVNGGSSSVGNPVVTFVAGQKTRSYLTPGYFKGKSNMYTSEEHHLYTRNDYTESTDWTYWVCQTKGCKARIKTKGKSTDLNLNEEIDCWFTDSYDGHKHPTKELKKAKQAKYEQLKVAVDEALPSSSTKTSVAREAFDKNVSPEE